MRSAKKALLMSVTAVVLCFAMLLGTTFAWFTDEVTSGANKIVAGNLDLEVSYKTKSGAWESIQDATALFDPDARWEPGHTEYVTLKVENKGSLALTYKMMVSPIEESGGINKAGEPFKLSQYLKFGMTAPSATEPSYAKREDVTVHATMSNLATADLRQGKKLDVGGAEYVTLIVTMPTTVGNEANHKFGTAAPEITLGIKAVATQVENESDSFDSTYDGPAKNSEFFGAGAYYEYFEAITETATASSDGSFTVKKTEDEAVIAQATVEAKAGAEITLQILKSSDATKNFTAAAEGEEAIGFEINVSGQTADSLVVTQLYVGTGLDDFKFYHNGTAMTVGTKESLTDGQFFYDKTEGYVYFATTSFSPFQATYKAPASAIGSTVYGTLADAVKAAKGGDTVALLKDVTLTEFVEVTKAITIDGYGHTLNRTAVAGNRGAFDYWNGNNGITKDLTVKNLVIKNDSAVQGYAVVAGMGGETVLFENCRFENLYCAVISNGCNGTDMPSVEVNKCAFANTTWVNSYWKAEYQIPPVITNVTGIESDKYVELFGKVAVYGKNGNFRIQFDSLSEALKYATDGETVTLLDNIVAELPSHDGYANQSVFEIVTDITLDGNGKTVTASTETWEKYNNGKTGILFSIGSQNDTTYVEDANVTVKNLNVVGHQDMKHGFTIVKSNKANTTATFENVTVTNCGANAFSVNGTNVTLTKVECFDCNWGAVNVDKSGNLTVNSGNYDLVKQDDTASTVTITTDSGVGLYQNGTDIYIYNVYGLRQYAAWANAGKMNGLTAILQDNIDLENVEWDQIDGAGKDLTFDGNGKTIQNLKISDGHNAGFFKTGSGCTIKNLTVDGATVTGVGRIAVICGHGMCVKVENCTVKNATVTAVVTDNDDGDKAGAIVGYLSGESNASVNGCKVENVTVKGYRDIGALVGYAGGTYTIKDNTLADVQVICDKSNNYKNYTTDAEYDVNLIVGEKTADGEYETTGIIAGTYSVDPTEYVLPSYSASKQNSVWTVVQKGE